jgi:glutaredoxin 3
MNIVIYSKSNCPNCSTAKALLNSKGIGFEEKNADNPNIRAALTLSHPHIRQMPAIWINGQHVGGLAGLQAALKELGL